MKSSSPQDSIDREIRGLALAKRLIRLEVRTDMITRFTAIPRSRLGALRRRLGVPAETRHRGPSPWRVASFVAGPDHRLGTSAHAALFVLYDLIGPQGGPAASRPDRLAVGERLCDIHEYVRELFPEIEIDFEGLVLLRTALVRREILETVPCRHCGCVIVVERNDRRHRTCEFCLESGMASGTQNGSRFTRPVSPDA